MPHTSRRKKDQSSRKRIEVTGEDGWTRVTTTDVNQRAPRPLNASAALEKRYADVHCDPLYASSEVVAGRTIEEMERQYKKYEKRWLESESCKALGRCLTEDVDERVLKQIDKCLVFGTGSYCGTVRGWIDRFDVAMTQLAVFAFVVDSINQITGQRPECFAQEPTYNDLDKEFLSRLSIATVSTPEGFHTTTSNSFVYTPGAELEVELRTLARNPAIALNGKLDKFWRNEKGVACTNTTSLYVGDADDADDAEDHDDGRNWKLIHELTEEEKERYGWADGKADEIEVGLLVTEAFKRDREERRLPDLDAKDMPFYGEHLYYRKAQDESSPEET